MHNFHGEESIILLQKARSRDYMFVLKRDQFSDRLSSPGIFEDISSEEMPSLVNLQLQDYCRAIFFIFSFHFVSHWQFLVDVQWLRQVEAPLYR